MTQIKELADRIEAEAEDAYEYAEQALRYKDSDRDLADCYLTLSKEELNHANMLHTQAVRLIKSVKETPPPQMLAVWDYLHKRHIEKEAQVKQLHAMYRE